MNSFLRNRNIWKIFTFTIYMPMSTLKEQVLEMVSSINDEQLLELVKADINILEIEMPIY